MKRLSSKLISPLKCSIFKPIGKLTKNLIIYNHCFSGNKLEGISITDYVGNDYALLVYDMRGAGNNMS